MTQEYEVPATGTILIGRSEKEIIEAGGNPAVAVEGCEYVVVDYDEEDDDLYIDGTGSHKTFGTFSTVPDEDGHSYLTFFKHKE